MTGRVIVEADGGSRGNPGPAGYGAVVFDAETHAVLAERFEAIGVETNNVAEYRGLIAGLEAAHELGATSVAIRMDSKLVIEQMSGRWQVKHPSMRPLAKQASALLAGFDDVTLDWIPRERNKHADALANRAMDGAAGIAPRTVTPQPAPTDVELGAARRRPDPADLGPARPHRAHDPASCFSGRNDQPLDDEGEHQAAALAHRIAGVRRHRGGDQLAASADPADGRSHRHRPRPSRSSSMDAVQEMDFGAWEGLAGADIRARWPEEFTAWLTTADAAPPGGESFEQVARRVRRARDELIRSYPGQRVVVVSHVTPIKTLLRLALDAPTSAMMRLHLDAASISRVGYFADGSASVSLFNDTAHLEFPGS